MSSFEFYIKRCHGNLQGIKNGPKNASDKWTTCSVGAMPSKLTSNSEVYHGDNIRSDRSQFGQSIKNCKLYDSLNLSIFKELSCSDLSVILRFFRDIFRACVLNFMIKGSLLLLFVPVLSGLQAYKMQLLKFQERLVALTL